MQGSIKKIVIFTIQQTESTTHLVYYPILNFCTLDLDAQEEL